MLQWRKKKSVSSNLSELAVLGEETTEELPWQEILFFLKLLQMLTQTTKLNINTLPILQTTHLLSTSFKSLASSQENHRFSVPHAIAFCPCKRLQPARVLWLDLIQLVCESEKKSTFQYSLTAEAITKAFLVLIHIFNAIITKWFNGYNCNWFLSGIYLSLCITGVQHPLKEHALLLPMCIHIISKTLGFWKFVHLLSGACINPCTTLVSWWMFYKIWE